MEDVIKNLSRRYAVKAYDSSARITDSQLDTLLEAGRLSPSSYGLQPYKSISATDSVLWPILRCCWCWRGIRVSRKVSWTIMSEIYPKHVALRRKNSPE